MKLPANKLAGLLCVFLGVVVGWMACWQMLRHQFSEVQVTRQASEFRAEKPPSFSQSPAATVSTNLPRPSPRPFSRGAHPDFSDEDQSEQLRLAELENSGQTILKSDFPMDRKMIRFGIRQAAERTLSQESGRYEAIFSQIGLAGDSNKVALLKQQIMAINEGSLLASQSLTQLAQARKRFDDHMRNSVSAEEYEQFRILEASRRSDDYLAELQRFAQDQDLPRISESIRSQLANLLRAHEPYAQERWIGPYDPPPTPRMGAEAIQAHFMQRSKTVGDAMTAVLGELERTGIPHDELKTVKEFFSAKAESMKIQPLPSAPPSRPRSRPPSP